jgi:hypothetical protein
MAWRVTLLVLLALWGAATAENRCEPLGTLGNRRVFSICANVFNSTVFVLNGTCQQNTENTVSSLMSIMPMLSNDACRLAYVRFVCSRFYTRCPQSVPELPPQSVCDSIANSSVCNGIDFAFINGSLASANMPFSNATSCNASVTVPFFSDTVPRYARCENYTGSVCAGLINYPVYIPADRTAADVERELLSVQRAFQAVNRFVCLEPLARLVCALALRPCTRISTPTNRTVGEFPHFPQRDLCDAVVAQCPESITTTADPRSLFRRLGLSAGCNSTTALQSVCSGESNTTAVVSVPTFLPPGGSVVFANLSGFLVRTGPNAMNHSISASFSVGPCSEPLVSPRDPTYFDESTNGSSCVLPCPSLLYRPSDYRNVERFLIPLSAVSWVLSTIMVATYVAFKKVRKTWYTIFFTVSLWFISFSLLWSAPVQAKHGAPAVDTAFANAQCIDNSQPSKEGWCVFQAFCFLFFGGAAVTWWFMQALDLYLQIRWDLRTWSHDNQKLKEVLYWVWGWGYPTLNVIIVGATGNFGNANNGIAWCFVIDSDLSWGVFYGPIAVHTFFGTVFVLLIIWTIYASSVRVGGNKKKGWWRIYVRPLIFVLGFLLVWSFIFAYRFSEHFNEDTYKSDSRALIQCLFTGAGVLNPSLPPSYDNCPHAKPDKAPWYMIQAILGCVGIIGFFLYQTTENLVMWYHLLLCKPYDFSQTTGDSKSGGQSKVPVAKSGSKNRLVNATSRSNLTASGSSGSMHGQLNYGAGAAPAHGAGAAPAHGAELADLQIPVPPPSLQQTAAAAPSTAPADDPVAPAAAPEADDATKL